MEFQYIILNCIIFTNEKLLLIDVVESPNCTFCQEKRNSSNIYSSPAGYLLTSETCLVLAKR